MVVWALGASFSFAAEPRKAIDKVTDGAEVDFQRLADVACVVDARSQILSTNITAKANVSYYTLCGSASRHAKVKNGTFGRPMVKACRLLRNVAVSYRMRVKVSRSS